MNHNSRVVGKVAAIRRKFAPRNARNSETLEFKRRLGKLQQLLGYEPRFFAKGRARPAFHFFGPRLPSGLPPAISPPPTEVAVKFINPSPSEKTLSRRDEHRGGASGHGEQCIRYSHAPPNAPTFATLASQTVNAISVLGHASLPSSGKEELLSKRDDFVTVSLIVF